MISARNLGSQIESSTRAERPKLVRIFWNRVSILCSNKTYALEPGISENPCFDDEIQNKPGFWGRVRKSHLKSHQKSTNILLVYLWKQKRTACYFSFTKGDISRLKALTNRCRSGLGTAVNLDKYFLQNFTSSLLAQAMSEVNSQQFSSLSGAGNSIFDESLAVETRYHSG